MKPCPFCGSEEIRIESIAALADQQTAYARCLSCEARGPSTGGEIYARERWNARTAAAGAVTAKDPLTGDFH